MNEIRYFSMFTGVGGFELGLENANSRQSLSKQTRGREYLQSKGDQSNNQVQRTETECEESKPKSFTCVGMSEFNKYSNQVLKYRFPKIKNWGDCTKIKPEDLPDFDMLCGGFPCQAFSIAGKRKGFEDTRGTMFFEVARILKVKRPKIVLLENVKGLLNHNKGETFRVILQTLDELGYEVQWMVLNSKFFGVPQNRERVFIIGNLRGTSKSEILPFGEDVREVAIESGKPPKISGTITKRYHKQGNADTYIKQLIGGSQGDRVYSTEGCSTTIASQAGGKGAKTGLYLEGFKIRRLTPIECERLQGFPDGWTEWGINEKGEKVKMSDTQRYKQMGNAVTTNVITAIGSQILNKGVRNE